MTAVQALTGSGGWPMSVWLTPDREPFFGGTYFPPRDGARGARHGFLTVLRDVHEAYASDPARVGRATAALVGAVRTRMEATARRPRPPGAPAPSLITDTVTVFKRAVRRPRRRRAPRAQVSVEHADPRCCCARTRRAGDDVALLMAGLTLEKMAAGGMYDQLGGGFHRYSTDARWLVPHFEKMLYDNALLVVAYAEAHQVTGRADFARVARDTLDYLLREMTAPEGGFYSATDADSKRPDGKSEEGAFFVWSEAEIRAAAGRRRRDGTVHPLLRRDRGGKLRGREHPAPSPRPRDDEPSTPRWRRSAPRCTRRARSASPPFRDDKILAAWNGLAISAAAVAGRIFDERRYVDAAARAADVRARRDAPGRPARAQRQGRPRRARPASSTTTRSCAPG